MTPVLINIPHWVAVCYQDSGLFGGTEMKLCITKS